MQIHRAHVWRISNSRLLKVYLKYKRGWAFLNLMENFCYNVTILYVDSSVFNYRPKRLVECKYDTIKKLTICYCNFCIHWSLKFLGCCFDLLASNFFEIGPKFKIIYHRSCVFAHDPQSMAWLSFWDLILATTYSVSQWLYTTITISVYLLKNLCTTTCQRWICITFYNRVYVNARMRAVVALV